MYSKLDKINKKLTPMVVSPEKEDLKFISMHINIVNDLYSIFKYGL